MNKCSVELVWTNIPDGLTADDMICQAARLSYSSSKTRSDNKSLIDYLLRHEHMSPFEFPNFTFHIKLPIFVMRQLVRHRTAKLNEKSGRYSEFDGDDIWEVEEWRGKSTSGNKQSSDGLVNYTETVFSTNGHIGMTSREVAMREYQNRLSHGVAKEVARVDLPLSTMTEIYWQMDLRNLLHFLKLRLDPHAQKEIVWFAERILEIIRPKAPDTVESWENHIRNAVKLSADEMDFIISTLRMGSGFIDNPSFMESINTTLGISRAKEFWTKIGNIYTCATNMLKSQDIQ